MKVLIVDDMTFMRATIKRILEKKCTRDIQEAVNGKDAVAKYKTNKPDLVIMDISMPVMNGIEAVREIRKIDPDARIIICSLLGQRSNVLEAIKAGANSFLVKPIREDKLLAEISKLALPMSAATIDEMKELLGLTDSLEEEHSSSVYLKGIEEGYTECKREVTSNMLRNGLSLDVIERCVELTEEEIAQYAEEYNLKMPGEEPGAAK